MNAELRLHFSIDGKMKALLALLLVLPACGVAAVKSPPVADADGDGIPDAEDYCPRNPGVRAADKRLNGCPAVPVVEVVRGDSFVVRILFRKGESVIPSENEPKLEALATVVAKGGPTECLLVIGHGWRDDGVDLRELAVRRAKSVRARLLPAASPNVVMITLGMPHREQDGADVDRYVELRWATPEECYGRTP